MAGAKTVIICGRRMDPLLVTKSAVQKDCPRCEVQPLSVDVTEEESVQNLFKQVIKLPDVLINNAGVASPATVVDSDTALWWKDLVHFPSS